MFLVVRENFLFLLLDIIPSIYGLSGNVCLFACCCGRVLLNREGLGQSILAMGWD